MTEVTDEMIRAAQDHDRETRPANRNWSHVYDDQVRRLLEGALAVIVNTAGPDVAATIRSAALEQFGDTIKQIADETTARKLAELEAAVRANERRRIRELADRVQAVCMGGEGASFFFSALLEDHAEGDAR